MDPEMIKKALDAIKNGDADAALALLEGMVASAAGAGEEAPAEEAPAEMADEPEEEPVAAAEGEDEEDEEAPAAMAAASRLMRMSGKSSIGAAVEEAETWRASHLTLSAEKAKLAKEREALEAGERKQLVASLVKLGVEIPATAWEDSTKSVLKPCKRLASEPIAELRSRVAKLSAAKGGKVQDAPKPPTSSASGDPVAKTFTIRGETVELSERELAICAEQKCKLEVFAANKLTRLKAQNKGRAA